MKSKIERLGKVSITVEKDYWDKNKTYNRLTIVERQGTRTAYLSRKVVPIGVEITDRNYWITISKWADIPYEIVQEFGDSPEVVISQKVVTLKINELQELIDGINEIIGEGGSIDERISTAKSEVKSEIVDDASEEGDTLKKLDDRLSDVEDSVGEGGSIDERIAEESAKHYTKEETYNKTELNSLITTPNQKYASVIATAQTTAVTDVLPATGDADTIYRVGNWDGTQYNDAVFSEYAWNGSAYIKLSTKSQVGEVYDISANHADTKYADLDAALGTNGANIPQSVRKGGMSVKYVQSSDNKYVQYRLMADEWSVDTTQWAICDDGVYIESPEFVYIALDNNKRLLVGIRKSDGKVFYGAGIPPQVEEYITGQINTIKQGTDSTDIDGINKIIIFLNDFSTSDTLKNLLDAKVDKIPGKSLIQEQVAENIKFDKNPEFLEVEIDSDKKVLSGRRSDDGKKFENIGFDTPEISIGGNVEEKTIEDPEGRFSIVFDKDNRVIEYLDKTGKRHLCKPTNQDDILANEISEFETFVGNNSVERARNTPLVPAWSTRGYYSIAQAVASRRFQNSLNDINNILVDEKLNPNDKLTNTGGRVLYYDGYLYLTKYQNHMANGAGNGEPEYLNIAKYDIAQGEITNRLMLFGAYDAGNNYIAVDLPLSDGTTFHCAREYQDIAAIIDGKLKVVGALGTREGYYPADKNYAICATINLDTLTVERYDRCTRTYNNVTENWEINGNMDPLMGPAVAYDGTKYYYGVCPLLEMDKMVIARTEDFINWEYVRDLPDSQYYYGEIAIAVRHDNIHNKDFCYVLCRAQIKYDLKYSNYNVLIKFDMITWDIDSACHFPAGSSMPSFFEYNDKLYALVCGSCETDIADLASGSPERSYYRIMKINEVNLDSSYFIADANNAVFGANTNICEDANHNLYSVVNGMNLKLIKVVFPRCTQAEANVIIDSFINMLN